MIPSLRYEDKRFEGEGVDPNTAVTAALEEYDEWAKGQVALYGPAAVARRGTEIWDVFYRVERRAVGVMHIAYLRLRQ